MNISKSYVKMRGEELYEHRHQSYIDATFAVAKRKPERKIQACTAFKPLTSEILVWRSYRFITNHFNDLLPAGLLTQLVRELQRYRRG